MDRSHQLDICLLPSTLSVCKAHNTEYLRHIQAFSSNVIVSRPIVTRIRLLRHEFSLTCHCKKSHSFHMIVWASTVQISYAHPLHLQMWQYWLAYNSYYWNEINISHPQLTASPIVSSLYTPYSWDSLSILSYNRSIMLLTFDGAILADNVV